MKKKVWGILFLCAILVNVLAWRSVSFCDFYVRCIFPVLGGFFSKITAAFPFSIGEWMLVAAVLFMLAYLTAGLLRLTVRRLWSIRLFRGFSQVVAWTGLVFFWIMTCNCFIQYHASAYEELYMQQVRKEGYTPKELAQLRDFVVSNLNELAPKMPRDADGYLCYQGDLNEGAVAAMQNLGKQCSQLSGYYPKPKEIYFSDLLSQSHMMGYYFPFSMEANYNGTMYVVNKPSTMCHELAHLKGFIQEDEAGLIGYLACIHSEDDFFRYSGYMGVLSYVEKEFQASIKKSRKEYRKHPAISPLVYQDCVFLTKEAWQEVEQKAVVSTKTAKKVSKAATTASLKINGVEEGMESYSGVVKLLLDYYDGILYGNMLVTVDADA